MFVADLIKDTLASPIQCNDARNECDYEAELLENWQKCILVNRVSRIASLR